MSLPWIERQIHQGRAMWKVSVERGTGDFVICNDAVNADDANALAAEQLVSLTVWERWRAEQ